MESIRICDQGLYLLQRGKSTVKELNHSICITNLVRIANFARIFARYWNGVNGNGQVTFHTSITYKLIITGVGVNCNTGRELAENSVN